MDGCPVGEKQDVKSNERKTEVEKKSGPLTNRILHSYYPKYFALNTHKWSRESK